MLKKQLQAFVFVTQSVICNLLIACCNIAIEKLHQLVVVNSQWRGCHVTLGELYFSYDSGYGPLVIIHFQVLAGVLSYLKQ